MKSLYRLSWVVALTLVLGCAEKKNPQAEIAAQNLNSAKALFAAFNQHDWNKMADFYAKDALFLDPAYGKTWVKKNHEEFMDNYKWMQKSAPDIKDELTAIFAADDKVSIQFTSTGTTEGQQWSIPISTILTFKDGKIIKDATYYDK
ncbi:nuclear transport factor 2 family protein [Pedobacter sp. Hv1]|uniref:nuclear transport factor 2 family protein n=1 Tax=Pedobacter sp. Hv1 TaxID=1740090 RepID=UPI0013793103|nr:nuclear transport factor 2 family protein [Pedobacter sp. Hv1]